MSKNKNKELSLIELKGYNMKELRDCIGKTITVVAGMKKGSDNIILKFSDGTYVRFYHDQDCCECVVIDDVVGDPNDLIGTPLLNIEEVSNEFIRDDEFSDVTEWTFYKFATRKGYVDVKWYGSSNGYYSTAVYTTFGVCKK